MPTPTFLRCSLCDAPHFALDPAELAGQPRERYERCDHCGASAALMAPSELRLDELTAVIPACLLPERA